MENYTAILMTVSAVVVIGVAGLLVLMRASARERDETPAGVTGGATSQPYDARELERSPIGTLALLLVYLAIVAALWGSTYFTLLRRG